MSIRRLASYGGGFHMTRTVYSIDADAPTLWECMYKDPPRIAVPARESKDGLVQVAMLDKVSFPRLDVCRRVYSPDGIAPTIHTCGGGGTEPKIIVEDCR